MKISGGRFILIAGLFWAGSASAAALDPMPRHYISNQQLTLFCTTVGESDFAARSFRPLCQNYILGVVDGHKLTVLVSPKPLRSFCLSEGIFNAQLTDSVIAWLKKNNVKPNEPAAPTVFSALKDGFPCAGTRK